MTPPTTPDPAPPAPPPPPPDSIGRGVLYAILCQIGALILSAPLMFTIWGLIQWIGLIPVYLYLRNSSRPSAAKAVLITGFVGVLINGGCAVLIFSNLGNMH